MHVIKTNVPIRVFILKNELNNIVLFSTLRNFSGNVVAANDICLIRLASLLTYGSNVQPIALALANSNPSGTATLSGWGSIGPPTNAAASTLQFVHIPILHQTRKLQYIQLYF